MLPAACKRMTLTYKVTSACLLQCATCKTPAGLNSSHLERLQVSLSLGKILGSTGQLLLDAHQFLRRKLLSGLCPSSVHPAASFVFCSSMP